MIEKQTVLILGAGSSVEFGFPTGPQLKDLICSMPKNRSEHAEFFNALGSGEKEQLFKEFCSDLFRSGTQSVDAFLEERDDYNWIGKAAIAAALYPLENEKRLFSNSSSWYHRLFAEMSSHFDEFAGNRLSILTYNYDRSLEHFLFQSLMHRYNKPGEECAKMMRKIPIIHLHGDLGILPFMGDRPVPYDGKIRSKSLTSATQSIRIVHEVTDEPQFKQARQLLEKAEIVCYLGFGFNEVNLDRLNISLMCAVPSRAVFGTAYDVGKAKRARIESYFLDPIRLGYPSETIGTFLENYPVIVQPHTDPRIL